MPDRANSATFDDEVLKVYLKPIFDSMNLLVPMICIIASNKYFNNESIAMLTGFTIGAIFEITNVTNYIMPTFATKLLILKIYYPLVITKLVYSCDPIKMVKTMPLVVLLLVFCFIPIDLTLGFISLNSFSKFDLESIKGVTVMGALLGTHGALLPAISSDRTRHFESLMIAESIIGTGLSGSYMYLHFTGVLSQEMATHEIIVFMLFMICRSVIIGFTLGYLFALILRLINNDWLNAAILIATATYITYWVCEITWCSGVIGAFFTVMMISRERENLSRFTDNAVQIFFKFCERYVSTYVQFVFSMGLIVDAFPHFNFRQVGFSMMDYGSIVASRLLWFVAFLPILSRVKKEYDLRTIMAMSWCFKLEPQTLYIYYMIDPQSNVAVTVFGLYLLVNTINMNTVNPVLKLLGFLKWSKFTESSIHNAMVALMNQRDQHLSSIKMNRTFTDANWSVIYNTTNMPNLTKYGHIKDRLKWLSTAIICPNCRNAVTFEPTHTEINLFTREVRIRILKALKVSFVRQFEQGFLSNLEFTILLQSIEMALDTDGLSLKYEQLCKFHKQQNKRCDSCNIHFVNRNPIVPEKWLPRHCHKLMNKKISQEFFLCMNLFCALAAILELNNISEIHITVKALDIFFQTVFVVEIILLVLSYSYYSLQQGISTYFRVIPNIISFILVTLSFIDIILMYSINNDTVLIMTFNLYSRGIRITRLVLVLMSLYIQETASHSLPVAVALLNAYEEITDLLPTITENQRLHQVAKTKLDTDKLRIIKDLGLAEVMRPILATRIKTMQAVMVVLKTIKNTINDLKVTEWLENYEYLKLMNALDNCVHKSLIIQAGRLEYKQILLEIPWIADDETLIEYIHSNIEMKMWMAGDTVVHVGDRIEGVVVITAGMLKLSYVPSERVIEYFSRQGMLPIKDYLRNTNFAESEESYIMVGNSIGELCLLTNRVYNVAITAYKTTEAYVLPYQVLQQAMSLSLDPVNGLQSRMWKCVLMNIVRSVLRQNPLYRNVTFDAMNEILNRVIIPNLVCFKVLNISELIQSVLVVEGTVYDHNTGDDYIAPCYIPRATLKINMGTTNESLGTITPRLAIIPVPGLNAYDVIHHIEMQSELMESHNDDCLLHVKHYHSVHDDINLEKMATAKPFMSDHISFLSQNNTLNIEHGY